MSGETYVCLAYILTHSNVIIISPILSTIILFSYRRRRRRRRHRCERTHFVLPAMHS